MHPNTIAPRQHEQRLIVRALNFEPLRAIASNPHTPRGVLRLMFKAARRNPFNRGFVPPLYAVIFANPAFSSELDNYRNYTRETLITARASNPAATDTQLRDIVEDYLGSTSRDQGQRYSPFVRAIRANPNASAATIKHLEDRL